MTTTLGFPSYLDAKSLSSIWHGLQSWLGITRNVFSVRLPPDILRLTREGLDPRASLTLTLSISISVAECMEDIHPSVHRFEAKTPIPFSPSFFQGPKPMPPLPSPWCKSSTTPNVALMGCNDETASNTSSEMP